jgi:hypothetical protein
MKRFKILIVALAGLLLLTNMATCADSAKEAYEKGNAYSDKGDFNAAIASFTEASQ